jgi:hypothetical protein
MQVAHIISRNRKIPGKAAGYIFFVIKWPGGTLTDGYCLSIEPAIRLFTKRFSSVPPAEHKQATAYFDVEVRKARGGFKREKLATWTGDCPLPEFFRAARQAWKRMPKEHDGKGFLLPKNRVISDENVGA